MLMHLTEFSQEPLYKQLTNQLVERILSGGLPEGEELPTVGKMARRYRLNMNAVKRAYRELEKSGFVRRHGGDAVVVASHPSQDFLPRKIEGSTPSPSPLGMIAILTKQLSAASHAGELIEILKRSLRVFFSTGTVIFALQDDPHGRLILHPSAASFESIPGDSEDPLLRLIAGADAPLKMNHVPISTLESRLLKEMQTVQVQIIVPLNEAGRFTGFIALSEKTTGISYTEEELSIISVVASQFAIAYAGVSSHEEIVAKRNFDRQFKKARQIQTDLLPKELPRDERVSVSAYCNPSHMVGGDYYDCIRLDDHRYGFVIADACGNGLPAAMLISQTQAILKNELSNGNRIDEILRKMNNQIVQDSPRDTFVTLFFGILDTRTGEFQFANCGHYYPLLVRCQGDCEQLQRGGLALGMIAGAEYEVGRTVLSQADTLVFFTDGLTEIMDDTQEEYGEERLRQIVMNSREKDVQNIVQDVLTDASEFAGTDPGHDDCTIMVVKIGPTSQE